MDAKFHRSLASLEQLARILRDVNDAAELVREFGQIEANRAELVAQRDALLAEVADLRSKTDAERAKLNAELEELAKQIVDAGNALQKVREEAETEGREIRERAKLSADEIIARANQQAAKIADAASQQAAELKAQEKQISDAVERLVVQRDSLTEQILDLERKMEEARAAAAKIIGLGG